MSENEVRDAGNLQKYFASVPHLISDDARLTVHDRALYLYYKRVAGENGTCYQSNKTVSERTGIGATLMKECRARLIEHGYIEMAEVAGATTLITVVDVWDANFATYAGSRVATPLPSRVATPSPSPADREGVAEREGGSRVATPKNNPLRKTLEEKPTEEKPTEEKPPARKAPAFIKALILSEAEQGALTESFPLKSVPEELAKFNDYQRATGRGYSDHMAAFRNWLRRPSFDGRTNKTSGSLRADIPNQGTFGDYIAAKRAGLVVV